MEVFLAALVRPFLAVLVLLVLYSAVYLIRRFLPDSALKRILLTNVGWKRKRPKWRQYP
jgi:hypothetical protein